VPISSAEICGHLRWIALAFSYRFLPSFFLCFRCAHFFDCSVLLCGNSHDYCNKKNCCRVLLQRYYLQPLLTKVTLLVLEGIARNMTLLQSYFIVAGNRFSSSASFVLRSAWKSWKLTRNFSLSYAHDAMDIGSSLSYQLATAFSRDMMNDSARVISSPPDEAIAAS
jgi:hypothetical protein